jgi:hypothetical protein
MALLISLTADDTSIGVAFPEAYAKIGDYFGNKQTIQYQVSVWADAQARLDNKAPVRQDAFYVEMADLSGDLLPALYENLKTIAPYDTGVDV